MKKLLLLGLLASLGMPTTVFAQNYSIDDVLGTYNGTYIDYDYNEATVENVVIEKGNGANALVIKNLFSPKVNENVAATFNPADNTISISAQYLGNGETYYLYAYADYNDYYADGEDTVILTVSGNTISLPEPQGLWASNDTEDYPWDGTEDEYMDTLVLTKQSSSSEEPEPTPGYDINEVLGTYSAECWDYDYNISDWSNPKFEVVIEKGETENSLVLKNFFAPISGESVKATYNPEDNTISIEEQWVDFDYYLYPYDLVSDDWADYVVLKYDNGTITTDCALDFDAYYNQSLPEIWREDLVLVKTGGPSTDEPDEPDTPDTPGSVEMNYFDVNDGNAVIYNLNGVRVSKDRLTKGIYIINGKKVLVK